MVGAGAVALLLILSLFGGQINEILEVFCLLPEFVEYLDLLVVGEIPGKPGQVVHHFPEFPGLFALLQVQLFEILLVRCRDGVLFPPAGDAVRVAFVLVGSPDERNYHLRALMHIAHIVQERDFIRRWLDAPQAEHLRDIVLLSKRKREYRQER